MPADHDVALVRADNPSPFTLEGTNTWVVGREPAWVVDPGPLITDHVTAIVDEVMRRGGLEGIVLTHDHADHAEAAIELRLRAAEAWKRDRYGDSARGRANLVPIFAARGDVDVVLHDGDPAGPFTAVATPGHASDHLAYVLDGAAFTGDAVLGRGSVFIAPSGDAVPPARSSLGAYLDGLRRLRALPLDTLYPGHGPVVDDAAAKLDEYLAHRLDRERRLLEALDGGARTTDELLDRVWDDAPPALRGAATVTLAAHLEKLAEEGLLPAGVERPSLAGWPTDA
jgi:glyoxylase-like metal-dependent hydrolase (beta-lactamase superfamily II)